VCQAVERAYRAGITVVASAGNRGRTSDGKLVLGSVSTPGNSPFAFTVGALNANGTSLRSDDVLATYSAKGPTRFDRLIKPDIVAPGNGIVGLLARNASLSQQHPELVSTIDGVRRLQLSGTSMAAAAVSGAIALTFEYQPSSAPAYVRTVLQASASLPPGSPLIANGAGSLNVLGALAAIQSHSTDSQTTIAGEVQTPGQVAFGHALDTEHAARLFNNSSYTVYWGETNIIYWGDSDIIYWGDDIIYWGDDIIYWGDDIIYWGDDIIYWGDDIIYWGD
jgi:subtilisin family serine protease